MLYKLYCLGLLTYEPNIILGPLRIESLHYCSLSFFSMFSLFLLYILVLMSGPFLYPLFLIYFSFSHILTIHPHLTYLLSRLLSLSIPEESGERNLLNCDLHCSSHFLINAADKVIAHHLMQR